MIERLNGRISEVLAARRFRSGEHLAETLRRYVNVYNHHILQRARGLVCPLRPSHSDSSSSLSCSLLRLVISRGFDIQSRHAAACMLWHVSPAEALRQWQQKHPEFFILKIDNLPVLDC